MTRSEQPQHSEPQSDEAAKPSSTTTQTVEDHTEQQRTEQHEESETADGAPASDEASAAHSGEVLTGTDVPPPWQRATAPPSGGETVSSETGNTSRSSDAEDTQKIVRPAQESTASFGGATAPTTTSTGSEQAGSTSFAERVASRASAALGKSGISAKRPNRGPRRASLQIKRVDPWSVLKLALVLSVALFFVWMIAVAVLYGVLDGMGVWDQLNGTFTELTQADNAASQPLISAGRVFTSAAIVGGINAVLMTALATVAAFIYNVAADLAGGIEVTLSERE